MNGFKNLKQIGLEFNCFFTLCYDIYEVRKMSVGERMRGLREDLEPKMNQTQLGRIMYVSQNTISNLEIGRTEPDMEMLRKYCLYFNVSADYILGLINEPKPLKN